MVGRMVLSCATMLAVNGGGVVHDRFQRAGTVEWIGLTPKKKAPLEPVERVVARVGTGLDGDRHAVSGRGSKRQVTLIQAEHFAVITALQGQEVTPAMARRNVSVSGINLFALRYATFRVGGAVLRGTGTCPPCARMEANLGAGGFNAMRGHGGICAVVEEEGEIAVGDPVVFVSGGRPVKGEE